ncbi:DUF3488 and DUF4129 domain-containing transglutaminase family protein [Streptomyces sp. NPDC007088]|uniref:transglutaminase TgpA family protein n=1 Tax=Streptomyces sp. NPDC007088 TaxID=3364773 RepID=UPI0036A53C60
MSGRGRLAVCAAVATVLSAGALLPLVQTYEWLFEVAFLLALVVGAGALARRASLSRPLTVLIQSLVTVFLLTFSFVRDQALAGVVPGPAAVERFWLLLQAGRHDVQSYTTPAPLTDGITLMLVGGVLVIGLLVDFLAVTLRAAGPAGLPLLALYSVAAGLSQDGSGWWWFLLAAGGYLVLLLSEGRDRVAQWGRVFGAAPRAAGRPGPGAGRGATAPLRTGRRIGVLALGVALVVPLALPALDGGLLDGRGGGGRGKGGTGTISAVNPLLSLQNSLNQPEDREVMTYRTDSENTQDMYLRIVSLDEFDGTSWSPSERRIVDVPDTLPAPAGLAPGVDTAQVRTRVKAAGWYAQDWLPMPYPATGVQVDGRWRFEPEGRTLVGERGQTTRGADYAVTSLEVRPTARELSEAPPPPPDVARVYTRTPGNLPPVVARTARQVTRGADNDYERAVKLQDWFAYDGGFTYNTQVRAGSGPEAIARFLKDKEGFCVHFAFSMAAMARTLDIPARVAVGFTPGTSVGEGRMSVGLRDAHAWPELYFQGVGWTRFEPTPSRGSTPEYTQPETPSSAASDPALPRPSASAGPSEEPSASETGCPPALRHQEDCSSSTTAVTVGSSGGGTSAGAVALIVLAAVLVLLLPLSPMLWRRRVRARRLSSAVGRSPEALAGRTLAAWQEVVDTAWDHGIAPDEALTPRAAAARIVRLGELDGPAAEAAGRLAVAVEQVRYAPRAEAVPGLPDEVRRVRAGLRAGCGRRARWRAELAPRSAVRVLWAVSDRRSALAERLRWRRPRTS